jgi:hypothetical protein
MAPFIDTDTGPDGPGDPSFVGVTVGTVINPLNRLGQPL